MVGKSTVAHNILKVLGLQAEWYAGSAFTRYLQSYYLNDVHLVPSVVLRGNELLTKVPMDRNT